MTESTVASSKYVKKDERYVLVFGKTKDGKNSIVLIAGKYDEKDVKAVSSELARETKHPGVIVASSGVWYRAPTTSLAPFTVKDIDPDQDYFAQCVYNATVSAARLHELRDTIAEQEMISLKCKEVMMEHVQHHGKDVKLSALLSSRNESHLETYMNEAYHELLLENASPLPSIVSDTKAKSSQVDEGSVAARTPPLTVIRSSTLITPPTPPTLITPPTPTLSTPPTPTLPSPALSTLASAPALPTPALSTPASVPTPPTPTSSPSAIPLVLPPVPTSPSPAIPPTPTSPSPAIPPTPISPSPAIPPTPISPSPALPTSPSIPPLSPTYSSQSPRYGSPTLSSSASSAMSSHGYSSPRATPPLHPPGVGVKPPAATSYPQYPQGAGQPSAYPRVQSPKYPPSPYSITPVAGHPYSSLVQSPTYPITR